MNELGISLGAQPLYAMLASKASIEHQLGW
jgi:hypothetical protein